MVRFPFVRSKTTPSASTANEDPEVSLDADPASVDALWSSRRPAERLEEPPLSAEPANDRGVDPDADPEPPLERPSGRTFPGEDFAKNVSDDRQDDFQDEEEDLDAAPPRDDRARREGTGSIEATLAATLDAIEDDRGFIDVAVSDFAPEDDQARSDQPDPVTTKARPEPRSTSLSERDDEQAFDEDAALDKLAELGAEAASADDDDARDVETDDASPASTLAAHVRRIQSLDAASTARDDRIEDDATIAEAGFDDLEDAAQDEDPQARGLGFGLVQAVARARQAAEALRDGGRSSETADADVGLYDAADVETAQASPTNATDDGPTPAVAGASEIDATAVAVQAPVDGDVEAPFEDRPVDRIAAAPDDLDSRNFDDAEDDDGRGFADADLGDDVAEHGINDADSVDRDMSRDDVDAAATPLAYDALTEQASQEDVGAVAPPDHTPTVGGEGHAAPPLEEQTRMVEAMLFASDAPLSTAELGERMPIGCDPAVAVRRLEQAYETRGVRVVRVAGKWAFRTAPDLAYLMTAEAVETRKLSKAAIETLAIVAYHQPVTRAEIEEIRQVSVSKGTIDLLMELEWVKLGRRRQTPGRPVTFITTEKFLDHFGLETTKDLPGLDELRQAGLLDNRPAIGPNPVDGEPLEIEVEEDEEDDDKALLV